jgi:NAD(P)-dependent dehydrogenase (short-subunit alcohol dehydrogenase family)
MASQASGMGRAMAEHGADLMLADRNRDGLDATAEKIAQLGRRAVSVECDVSQPDRIRTMWRI